MVNGFELVEWNVMPLWVSLLAVDELQIDVIPLHEASLKFVLNSSTSPARKVPIQHSTTMVAITAEKIRLEICKLCFIVRVFFKIRAKVIFFFDICKLFGAFRGF